MKITELEGVKKISKTVQKTIKGGHNIDIWCLKKCLNSGYPASLCHDLCSL